MTRTTATGERALSAGAPRLLFCALLAAGLCADAGAGVHAAAPAAAAGAAPAAAVAVAESGAAAAAAQIEAGNDAGWDMRQVQMLLEPLEQSRGSTTAPLTMVEFTDYQCPYCRRFQAEVWPQLKHDYVDTGKLRFIVRDLPLSFHAGAKPAAEAAHCAAEQGKFWPMHDALLDKGTALSAAGLEQQARTLKLDVKRFDDCLASGKYAAAIERNAAQADALGLRGTPAFVIGRVQHGQLTGTPIEGALPYEEFNALLKELLAGS